MVSNRGFVNKYKLFLEEAYNNNIPIVVATGNDNHNYIYYPANSPYTIATGALKPDMEERKDNSNYGLGLDVCAPGEGLYSTDISGLNGYNCDDPLLSNDLDDTDYSKLGSGTSFAAPMVSGAIALMLDVNPNLSIEEIRTILHNTSDKIGDYTYTDGFHEEVGYGRLNVYEAVKASLIMGDVNKDSRVDIADVIFMIQTLVSYISPSNPSPRYIELTSDLNGDEVLNALDIVILINQILDNALPSNEVEDSLIQLAKTTSMVDDNTKNISIDILNEIMVKVLHVKVASEDGGKINEVTKGDISQNIDMEYAISVDSTEVSIMLFGGSGQIINPSYGNILNVSMKSEVLSRSNSDSNGEIVFAEAANSSDALLDIDIIDPETMGRIAQFGADNSTLPEFYALLKSYPNPFNPIISIPFTIPEKSHVNITIYDLNGKKIQTLINDDIFAGYHSIYWNASSFPSGTYLVKMTCKSLVKTNKITLLK